jgi:uncharacterized damage-inducible protein DinB
LIRGNRGERGACTRRIALSHRPCPAYVGLEANTPCLRSPIMRSALCVLLTIPIVFASSAPAAAQSSPSDFLVEFSDQFEASAGKFVALAEAMPADAYDWRPMEGVASVGSVYAHIARYNYFYPETALDRPSPMGRTEYDRWEDEAMEKTEIVALLRESMAHVRRVAAAMSEMDLNEQTRLYGRDVGQWAVLLQLVTHMNEHLGQSIAYARMNRVVPPWSM